MWAYSYFVDVAYQLLRGRKGVKRSLICTQFRQYSQKTNGFPLSLASTGVRDVLFTGGDPMVMSTKQLERYIDPLLQDPTLNHLRTIRIGTKSLAYWPYRYVTNDDADDLLR